MGVDDIYLSQFIRYKVELNLKRVFSALQKRKKKENTIWYRIFLFRKLRWVSFKTHFISFPYQWLKVLCHLSSVWNYYFLYFIWFSNCLQQWINLVLFSHGWKYKVILLFSYSPLFKNFFLISFLLMVHIEMLGQGTSSRLLEIFPVAQYYFGLAFSPGEHSKELLLLFCFLEILLLCDSWFSPTTSVSGAIADWGRLLLWKNVYHRLPWDQ